MSEETKKKVHPLDRFIVELMDFINPEGSFKDRPVNRITWTNNKSELTEIVLVRDEVKHVTGHLIHEGMKIPIDVSFTQTFKPSLTISFGTLFITSMAIDNKKAIDTYLKKLFDKRQKSGD